MEKNLEQVIEESIRKCDLDYQVKEATGILSEKLTSLECKYKNDTVCYTLCLPTSRSLQAVPCILYFLLQ